jgi:hypothetical protein
MIPLLALDGANLSKREVCSERTSLAPQPQARNSLTIG